MTNLLIDITDKISDPLLVDLMSEIEVIATKLGVPMFLVGAMARDLVLWYGFEIRPGRATKDFDLGVRVQSWEQYETLKKALVESGKFTATRKCRMYFQDETPVDILPFGPIDGSSKVTEWPPHDGEQLNMIGFDEAYDSSLTVRIRAEPPVDVRVASPAGLVILKLVAWNDRRPLDKDAIDLGVLIRSYLQLGNDRRLFEEHADLLEVDDFDFELAGAHLLGRDIRDISSPDTRELLLEILDRELREDGDLPLVVQSAATSPQINATLEFWRAIREELRAEGAAKDNAGAH
jgi:predicted nucleotidyltransferase